MRNTSTLLVIATLSLLGGCGAVLQSQQTPVSQTRVVDPDTGYRYWVYVPSYYSEERDWPLVITLHGRRGVDNSSDQIREWKALAEQHGFMVVAPDLVTPNDSPPMKGLKNHDLIRDEQVILACKQYMVKKYKVAPQAVLLTGFSTGGYPLYYTALHHPEEFSAVAALACNSDIDLFENITAVPGARKEPILIIHAQDSLALAGPDSWAAFRWLREHHFDATRHYKIQGGYDRQPQAVLRYWQDYLPKKYHMKLD